MVSVKSENYLFFMGIYFMCMSVWLACTYVFYLFVVPLAVRRGTLDPLELEFQMAVSHHVGTGN